MSHANAEKVHRTEITDVLYQIRASPNTSYRMTRSIDSIPHYRCPIAPAQAFLVTELVLT